MCTEYEIHRRAARIGTSCTKFVSLRISHFIMQVRANQLHGHANRNVVLAVPQLFWPANCIKKRHVKLLNGPSGYIRILCPCVQTSIIYVSKPPLLYIDVLHASFPNIIKMPLNYEPTIYHS